MTEMKSNFVFLLVFGWFCGLLIGWITWTHQRDAWIDRAVTEELKEMQIQTTKNYW